MGPMRGRAFSRRTVLAILLALSAAVVVASAVAAGGRGAAGAALGAGAGLAFVLAGPWLLEPVMRRSPGAALPAALGLYTVKAVAALVLLAAFIELDRLSDALAPPALAAGLLVVALTWTALQIQGFVRGRVPTYDLGNNP